jgi:peptidoglycan/xylan/chitin deacetylase (PgdA/CDA1 family)
MSATGLAAVAVSAVFTTTVSAADSTCQNSTSALGVSRVVEVDTSGGPRLGHQQSGGLDLLRDGEVALTFDDGPMRPYTRPVLNALAAHCTKATFFIVGRMAVADPELVEEIVRRGHTIGTHTWSHRNLRALLPYRAQEEIELGFSAVRKAAGGPIAPFFRFPYLSASRAMTTYLQKRQIGIFSIDADAYDYRTREAATVHLTVIRQLMERRKGILLFHDIQPSTARALRELLDDLQTRGFRVVHFVPSTAATTLPDYDAVAEKALAKQRIASASNPFAKRSLLWPLPPGGPGSMHAKRGVTSLARPAASAAPALAAPPSAPRPRQWSPAEERWQDRVFGN